MIVIVSHPLMLRKFAVRNLWTVH